MYPDSGYKRAHAQSVCTRPFPPRREGLGDEARTVFNSVSYKPLSYKHLHTILFNSAKLW